MSLAVCWLLFPAVLLVLAFGCGLLLRELSGVRFAAPLLPAAGFAVISTVALFPPLSSTTARLMLPLVVALAVAGLALSFPWRLRGNDPWWIAACLGIYAAFLAPVALSGEATFTGYIKLDDTATFLAMLDRFMEHGRDVSGLAPSSYEAAVSTSLAYGYPMGSLVPLGLGAKIVGQDTAWVWQPYLAFLAVVLGGCLYQLAAGLVRSRPLRALVAFVGTQAALLYGYALWGGIKEVATSAVFVFLAVTTPAVVRSGLGARSLLLLATASASVVAVLSLGGVAWLAAVLAIGLALALHASNAWTALRAAAVFALMATALAIPSIAVATSWLPRTRGFGSNEAIFNLGDRLGWIHVFGIWPSGDFRVAPDAINTTRALAAVVGLGAAAAVVLAWRARRWEVVLAAAGTVVALGVYAGAASPWIAAKALASSSPIVVALALIGAGALFESGRRVEAVAVASVVTAGVVWSDWLQYREALLAPRDRHAELAQIGERFAGRGPALLTEYEPYGARHFLRRLDVEGASELRRRPVYLATGEIADRGSSPDLDEIRLDSVLAYPTLVLRRSGVASRPPSAYDLAWEGRHYEVWERAASPPVILEHLPLGDRLQPAAVPPCGAVVRLAKVAQASGGRLAAVERPPAIVLDPAGRADLPTSFGRDGEYPGALHLTERTAFDLPFATRSPGTYGLWVGGSFRAHLDAWIDGDNAGSGRQVLSWPVNFVHMGDVRLRPGKHVVRLRYSGADLRPGSAGSTPFGLGPIAITRGTSDQPVRYVAPADARSLCGKSLDWLEAISG